MFVGVLVIACCGLGVLSFSRKRVLLLCFFYLAFGVLTIVNEDSVPLVGAFKLYRLAYPFLLLSIVVNFVQNPKFWVDIRRWPNVVYLALLLTLVVSSFYSPYVNALTFTDPGGVIGTLVVALLFWVAASHIQEREDFMTFGCAAAVLSTVLSLWVIWTAAQGDFAAFRGGTNVNENYESLYVLAGTVPLIQLILMTDRLFIRVLSSSGLLVTLLASSILASRGMLIAAGAGAMTTVLGFLPRLTRRRVIAVGAIFALILGVLILLPGTGNVVDAFGDVEVSTLDDRAVIWSYAWRHFASFGLLPMFFGEGLSSARSVLPSGFAGYGNYHNDYLMWLMEQGFVGVSLFLLFLYRVGRIIGATQDLRKHLMRGWFVYLLVAGMSATVSTEHLYWVILGSIVGAASQLHTEGVGQGPEKATNTVRSRLSTQLV